MSEPEIENDILNALVKTGRSEALVNAIEAVDRSELYERIFESVISMQNKNYIKVVYCLYPTVINVQLTRVGQMAHQNRRRL